MPAQDIDPRYLSYSKNETQELLDKVNSPDTAPTRDSENLITSGGVYAAISDKGEFYER